MRVIKKSSKKPLIITLAVLLVVGAGIVTFFLLKNQSSADEQQVQQQTDSTNETTPSESESLSPTESSQDSATPHESEKDITPSYEGSDANASQDLTGVINYASVVNYTLTIRTTINQALNSGTCQLTLTNGSKTVTKTSQITQNPSSSACDGFDIPTSELGSGTWNITITLTSDNRTGTLTSTVDI